MARAAPRERGPMEIQIVADDGEMLNAKVEVEPGAIIVHSRGGAFGKPNLRNPDHKRALETILGRLLAVGLAPSGVFLDSGPARAAPEEKRTLLAAAEITGSVSQLVTEIGKRGAAWGRPERAAGRGNTTKRVRIGVPGATVVNLAAALRPGVSTATPIIYFNIGWMRDYAGPKADDPTIGAHGYLDDHVHGAECFNFARRPNGLVRGYRPPGSRDQTNITRLGAAPGSASLSGVLVVWLAREPASGTTLIVGWYRDATVYREARAADYEVNNEIHHYSVEARAADATLLPPIARSFAVPSSRTHPGAGFGQKPTWYGAPDVDARVRAYVQIWSSRLNEKAAGVTPTPPKNLDPELRRKVERAAVEHAKAHYRAKYGAKCPIISVEAFGKGWDLEIFHQAEPLLVEVKGLLNTALICELTPNEFTKMHEEELRDRYVIYVVNNALAASPGMPIPSIFQHVGDGKWRTEDGRDLLITPKTGAVLSCA